MGYFTPRFVFQTSLLVVVCYMTMDFVVTRYEDKVNLIPSTDSLNSDEEKWTKSFQGFNNETGADRFIVPNIIHFIRFNQREYSFIDYVVIKAAMRNHRPDYFYIHTDAETVRRVRNTNGYTIASSRPLQIVCKYFVTLNSGPSCYVLALSAWVADLLFLNRQVFPVATGLSFKKITNFGPVFDYFIWRLLRTFLDSQ